MHLYKITTDVSGVTQHKLLHNISIYPNPADESLMIEFTTPAQPMRYEIFDVVGQRVMSGKLSNNLIQLSDLAKGAYLIMFNDETGNSELHKFF